MAQANLTNFLGQNLVCLKNNFGVEKNVRDTKIQNILMQIDPNRVQDRQNK